MAGFVPQTGWETFKSRNGQFSLAYPVAWKTMIRESPAGDSVVLYTEGKNIIRALVSKNSANKSFFEKLLSDPFKAAVKTDSGISGTLKIGASRSEHGRVIAWFYAENGALSVHLFADLDTPFAIRHKDTAMRVLKSLRF